MRIFFTADLHVDYTPMHRNMVYHIINLVEQHEINIVCIGGDISPDIEVVFNVLKEIQSNTGCRVLFVPGNHDIWVHKSSMDDSYPTSWDKLWNLGSDGRIHNLMENGPLQLGGVGFAGTMGWYDYTFYDAELNIPLASYERKWHNHNQWMDGEYARFDGMDDRQITRIFNQRLDKQLADLHCDKKIVISHHCPFLELQRKAYPEKSFFNAFGGNIGQGEIMLKHGVTHSLSGHLHRNVEAEVDGVQCVITGIGDNVSTTYKTGGDWYHILEVFG